MTKSYANKQASNSTEAQKSDTYILITQGLQNAFFLAPESRVCLPQDVVARMLVGHDKDSSDVIQIDATKNRLSISNNDITKGPLYIFLNSIVKAENNKKNIHIINIRDWHTPSFEYDEERKLYGIHAEAGTWESQPLEGFGDVLYPYMFNNSNLYKDKEVVDDDEKNDELKKAHSLEGYPYAAKKSKVTFYDVRSDSVFDFRPPASEELKAHLAKVPQELENGANSLSNNKRTFLSAILDKLLNKAEPEGRVYVIVIGVYTDIKVKMLLIGLRTRYDIQDLILSDVLTGAPTLERHIVAIDYIDKVLNVEIVHSITDLVHILEPGSNVTLPVDLIKNQINYSDYRNYFRDKQMILSYQDNQMFKYVELTSKKSEDTYKIIDNANRWLITIGKFLISLNIILVLLKIVEKTLNSKYHLELSVPTEGLLLIGGLTIAQFLTSFFLIPQAQLQNNIKNLVRLRNYLETHSNISALLRYHMTKLESLNLPKSTELQNCADKELDMLQKRIEIILNAEKTMSDMFKDLPININPNVESH